jgi:hypothetical protein
MAKQAGFVQWVRNQIVQYVPEEQALCEFDCRRGQCTQGEWAGCERRLSRGEGELMPSTQRTRKEPAA